MYAKPVADHTGAFAQRAPAVRRLVHAVETRYGVRVLTKLVEESPDVYVARISCSTARRLGICQQPGDLLGGISRTSTGFAPVAYIDRDHLLHGTGPVEYLDDVATLAEAAEALIAYRQGR